MVRGNTLADKLESWSQALFLVAGVLLLVYAVLLGAEAQTGTVYETVGNLVSGTGGALAFVGLLGLYRRFVQHTPWLTRAGGAAAAVGAVGFAVVAVRAAAVLFGVVGSSSSNGPTLVFIPILLGMVLGFALFALASHRAGPSASGPTLRLLAPTVVFLVVVAGGLSGVSQMWVSAVLATAHGLTYLAIGTALRAEATGETAVDRAPDSTV
ncbi:MAG: hypothetical protein ABEJ06_03750 [Haloarculaceae archaeon]